MSKVGDVVFYSAFGRTVKAIVMAVNSGDLSHQGKNGEPMLDLLYIDPARESAIEKKQIGYQPRTFIEHSVVHASQEFSDEYKRSKGITTPAQLVTQRGQGEWLETAPASAAAVEPAPTLVRPAGCEFEDALEVLVEPADAAEAVEPAAPTSDNPEPQE